MKFRRSKKFSPQRSSMFSLFLPEKCLHCEQPSAHSHNRSLKEPLSHYLCEVCLRMLHHHDAPKEHMIRHEFERHGTNIAFAHTLSAYIFVAESPLQSIIHAMKYDGMMKLGSYLGNSLSYLIPQNVSVIVPVPLHRTRLAERGYNQAEVIAKALSVHSNTKVLQAVKRVRPTSSQTHLSISERIENMRGAFALTRDSSGIEGKHILIVDDVMTTGSTLASVAETLMEAKPKSISTLALAMAMQTS
jgi:competence protein ComFC